MNTRTSPGATAQPRAIQEATPREVHQWVQAGQAVVIDVREPDEHAREWIAGSKLVPLSRFDPRPAAAHAKPGQRLVMHCRGGRRSADAARLAGSLAEAGITVVSMAGGIEAWKKENLPVEVNTQVSGLSVMRQVQLTIGLGVLAGSALAWFVDPRFIGIPAFFGAGLTFAGATGTCALASLLARMPWNKTPGRPGQCESGSCGC